MSTVNDFLISAILLFPSKQLVNPIKICNAMSNEAIFYNKWKIKFDETYQHNPFYQMSFKARLEETPFSDYTQVKFT